MFPVDLHETHYHKLFNEATYQTPLSIKMFDHIPKKIRTVTPTKMATPPINIYVSPLGDVTRQYINNTSSQRRSAPACDPDTEEALVHYPVVADVLYDLDQIMPLLDYPQYVDAFSKNGVIYTNTVLGLDTSFFVDIIGMPRPIIQAFLDRVALFVRRAEKGKGRAISVVKKEDNDDVIVLSD